MTRKREDIRLALDTTLSGASRDPALFNRVVNASKGDIPPVKRKLTLSMTLVLILALITSTVAIAVTTRGVSWFLEKAWQPVAIDDDYLLSDLRQNHNSTLLSPTVVDAYWDGLEFSIAYHVSPVDPTHTIRMVCNNQQHHHYQPAEDADILLHEPEFINVTDDMTGEIDHIYDAFLSTDWVYEEDGSLTAMVKFQLYNMSQLSSYSIPIFNTLSSTGMLYRSMLHCYPPTLDDPIPEHEHQWEDATCVSPKVCTICQRTEGDLGWHDFQPSEDGKYRTCFVCTTTQEAPASIPASFTLRPGDYTNHVWLLQLRLSELGYYEGPLSARYDDATTEAVKTYQESQGLEADGICRPETLQKLFP